MPRTAAPPGRGRAAPRRACAARRALPLGLLAPAPGGCDRAPAERARADRVLGGAERRARARATSSPCSSRRRAARVGPSGSGDYWRWCTRAWPRRGDTDLRGARAAARGGARLAPDELAATFGWAGGPSRRVGARAARRGARAHTRRSAARACGRARRRALGRTRGASAASRRRRSPRPPTPAVRGRRRAAELAEAPGAPAVPQVNHTQLLDDARAALGAARAATIAQAERCSAGPPRERRARLRRGGRLARGPAATRAARRSTRRRRSRPAARTRLAVAAGRDARSRVWRAVPCSRVGSLARRRRAAVAAEGCGARVPRTRAALRGRRAQLLIW